MSQEGLVSSGQGTFLLKDIVVTGWFLPNVISTPCASDSVPQSERPKGSRHMHPCAVVGCKAVDWLAVSTRHRLPRDEPLRSAWLQRIGLHPSDKRKTLAVCVRHFTPDDYYRNPQMMEKMGIAGRAVLKPEAVPTLHLPTSPTEASSRESVREALRSALAGGYSPPVLDTAAAGTAAEVPAAPVRCEVGTQMVTIQYTLGTQTLQQGRNTATQVHMGARMQLSVATQTGVAAIRRKRRGRRRVRR